MDRSNEPLCAPGDHEPSPEHPEIGEQDLERASRLLRALGDVPRLRLVSLLARGEICVTALAQAESESISTISQRLRVLRNERIVARRRRGKHINYVLADQHVMDLVANALAHATERPGEAK